MTPNCQIVRTFTTGKGPLDVKAIVKVDETGDEVTLPLWACIHDARDAWYYSPGKHVWVHPEALRQFG